MIILTFVAKLCYSGINASRGFSLSRFIYEIVARSYGAFTLLTILWKHTNIIIIEHNWIIRNPIELVSLVIFSVSVKYIVFIGLLFIVQEITRYDMFGDRQHILWINNVLKFCAITIIQLYFLSIFHNK